MWRECPTEQDEPISLPWGMQFSDLCIAIGTYLFLFIVLNMPIAGFLPAGGVLLALTMLKRGQPPGQHWHWLHVQELVRIPGACIPRDKRYSIWG